MELSALVEQYGEPRLLLTAGAVLGLVFGFMAQRSRFCMRAAVVETIRNQWGEKLAIWLLAFAAAVLGIQVLHAGGWFEASSSRFMAAQGSISGAVTGGLVFGIGMVLARGCPTRLLVLTAGGNMRSLLTGMVFAVTAQATLAGMLSPLRIWFSQLWQVEGGPGRDLLQVTGLGHSGAVALGAASLALSLYLGRRAQWKLWAWAGGLGVGLLAVATWWITYAISKASFEVIPVQGLTFAGPSADALMRVLTLKPEAWGFDAALIPAVFVGAFAGVLLGGDWKLEGFHDGRSMIRYIAGAVLMGFGAVMAGGCAVGAGLSGGAIFALTPWIALVSMWFSAGLTSWLIDPQEQPVAADPAMP
jgi:uncharacterized membrane protein YedE/YeeE